MFFNNFDALNLFYVNAVLLLTIFACITIKQDTLYTKNNNLLRIIILAFSLFLILSFGFRRISGGNFGDTGAYVAFFNLNAELTHFNDFSGEWLWSFLMYYISKFGDVSIFFLIVASLYIILHLIACYKLVKGRDEIMALACFSAFSFMSYGINGIRNGLACALIILAVSFIVDHKSKIEIILAAVLSFCAFNIHRSTALPIAAMLFCYYYKNTKYLIYFWFLSIPLSLVAGGQIEAFFSGLGFDDRMSAYSQGHDYDYMFSHSGFRWDFLLYSFMPILLGYYITFKQYIQDEKYSFILNVYIVCNAFWVLVIRTSSSNRFAYLSWFLYPIVLLYPLLSFPIFNQNNEKKVGLILFAHTAFTFYMAILY